MINLQLRDGLCELFLSKLGMVYGIGIGKLLGE